MRVAIHREGGFGDGILAAAGMQAIRRSMNPEVLDLYGNGKAKELACGNTETKIRGFGISIPLKNYDVVFDARPVPSAETPEGKPYFPWTEDFQAVYEAYHRHQPVAVESYFHRHGIVGFEEMWTHIFGMPCSMRDVNVQLVPCASKWEHVCIGPALGEKASATKTLSVEKWEAITEGIMTDDLQVWHIGDGAEQRVRGTYNYTHLSMPEQLGLLASARCYIGGDGFLAHAAAALGVPAVTVWGPTPWRVWSHRGHHRVVSPEAKCIWWTRPRWYEAHYDECKSIMSAISVDSVLEAVKLELQ